MLNLPQADKNRKTSELTMYWLRFELYAIMIMIM